LRALLKGKKESPELKMILKIALSLQKELLYPPRFAIGLLNIVVRAILLRIQIMKNNKNKENKESGFSENGKQQDLIGAPQHKFKKGEMSKAMEKALEAVEKMDKN
jgi:hypothetical protein